MQYPPLPPLLPGWMLIASGATVDVEEATAAAPVLEVATVAVTPATSE
jgi:50S ribosomal protein 6